MQEATDPDLLDALTRLVQALVTSFGPGGTVALLLLMAGLSFLWRWYNDYRKDKETNAVIAEKEATIQRLAETERSYRALFFKEKYGWTDAQVEQFVWRNEFTDPVEARRALENETPPPPKEALPKRKRGKR